MYTTMVLDPRFKNLQWIDDEEKSKAYDEVQKLATSLADEGLPQAMSSSVKVKKEPGPEDDQIATSSIAKSSQSTAPALPSLSLSLPSVLEGKSKPCSTETQSFSSPPIPPKMK